MVAVIYPARNNRPGVLLLVVLSTLTLFLMLGATYLAVARRARMASKAFAENVTAASTAGAAERQLVDEAFLAVVRGTRFDITAGTPEECLELGDDLLGDKYGHDSAILGRANDVSGGPGLLTLSASGLTPTPPPAAELNGRVITLMMPGVSVSTRILQATQTPGGMFNLVIPAGPTVAGLSLSNGSISAAINASTGLNIVINGREFSDTGTNEPYDGFDAENPLLTRLFPTEDYDGDGALSTNEDANGNGIFDHNEDNGNSSLDPGEDLNRNGILDLVEEDVDGDGVFDINEDLNGNSVLDSGPVVLRAPIYAGGSLTVDSDADGVLDSKFIDVGLPSFVDASGETVYPRAAITVVDLDGRLNLNTHGSQVDVDTINGTGTAYPLVGSGVFPEIPLENLPRGSGVGPADVSLMRSFSPSYTAAFGPAVSASATHADLASRSYVTEGGFEEAGRRTARSSTQWPGSDMRTGREVPRTAVTPGRYGDGAWTSSLTACDQRPGTPFVNDTVSHLADQLWSVLDGANGNRAFPYFGNSGRWSSPPDLKGRLRVWADPQTGQPVYYKPYWDHVAHTLIDNEVIDDPYEVQLNNRGLSSNDNIYSPRDLEGLLRYFDSDSMKLERRLVQLGEEEASANRNLFTTESWDTSAVVGTDWSDVIATNYSALLSDTALVYPQRAADVFSPEIITGQKLDINRLFHDSNPSEPNDPTGIARRQIMAKQLYCLMLAITRANDSGINITAEYAEMIAQYAVNIVDFRDPDSVITMFDYDPSFSPGSYIWNPTARVWGCERPELIITETLAWHDRRTDDASDGTGSEHTTTGPFGTGQTADNDFDQRRRPRGAFFVEITSPWLARAKEFGGAGVANVISGGETCRADPIDPLLAQIGTQDTNSNGNVDAGEDIDLDGSVTDPLDSEFGVEARVDLSRSVGVGAAASPVWRLVSVRSQQQIDGGTALGNDPLVAATSNPNSTVLDPSRTGTTAVIDRAFYFTVPGTTIQAALPNRNFWQDAANAGGPNPKLHQYVIAGTNAPFDFNLNGGAHPQTRVFVGANGQPATLTEPLTSTSDPYDEVMQHLVPGTPYTQPSAGNGYRGEWNPGHDVPFDSITVDEDVNSNSTLDAGEDLNSNGVLDTLPATVTATELEVVGSDDPILMQNGTHENFAIIHLQRLANPGAVWNGATNPYITVDCMPVDLVVVNLSGGGSNNDETGATGSPFLSYVAGSRPYYDRIGATEIGRTVERGGKAYQGVGGNAADVNGPDTNIWSRRIDPNNTDLRDADAFLSLPPTTSRGPVAGGYAVVGATTLAGMPVNVIHTLGSEDLNNNAIRDDEDINGNTMLDPGEDVNRNGVLDTPTITEDTDFDGNLDPFGGDLDEEDLDGDGAITIEGDINSDGIFLTGAPQRFVDLSVHPEPQKHTWLAWSNRPFNSVNELALVPWCSPFHLTRMHAADHSADNSPVTQVFSHLLGFFENVSNQPPYAAVPASPPTTFPWQAITGQTGTGYTLLDFLRVQSPYVALEKTIPVASNAAALNSLARNIYPFQQVSNYRDPGKINVNTISDPRVWRALFGDIRGLDDPAPLVSNYPDADPLPIWSPYLFGSPNTPATTVSNFFANRMPPPGGNDVFIDEDSNQNGVLDLGEDLNSNGFLDTHERDLNGNGVLDPSEDINLNGVLDTLLYGRNRHALTTVDAEQDLNGDGIPDPGEDINGNSVFDPADDFRNTDIHSAFRYQALSRLQNLVTVRSNVYAIWVTVGYFNNSGTEILPVKRNRGFYIFDRSIPVAYERGKDHNVRDAILLRRIIQ